MSPTPESPTRPIPGSCAPMSRRPDRRRSRALSSVLAVAALVLAWGLLRSSEARVRPYYVIQGASYGAIQPRILFVLDTSGSMGLQANDSNILCNWSECESTVGAETASRIATARAAINSVVTSVGDNASFALMTFEQVSPRTPPNVPGKCSPGTDQERRFTWVTQYSYTGGAYVNINRDAGVTGAWRLCQGGTIRPYPYLRWDELGTGSVISSNNETDEVPPSPLISTASGSIDSAANAQRRVQWFRTFMGVRVHLDDTNDPDHSITYNTIGDWGSSNADRDNNVRGHDFYYWPYVDGFPGYAQWPVRPTSDGPDNAGINADDNAVDHAHLYAPFYLDLSSSGIPADDWGPASREAGNDDVARLTSPIMEGGVDTDGPTPWASVIGDVSVTPPSVNVAFSHTTVASYLSFATGTDSPDACSPVSAVLVTDGDPSAGEGGATLYQRLADLRNVLNVDTYVVGFFLSTGPLNDMACAGAGACAAGGCSTPCDDTPADDWDTCEDPDNPTTSCAYVANDSAELVAALTSIVGDAVDVQLPSGQGSTINSFGIGGGGEPGSGTIVQTDFAAYTEFPGWRGHVTRTLCDDVDGNGDPLPHCVLPVPEFETEELEETFGPCDQSHEWDAGVCLQSTAWNERRLFTNGSGGGRTLIPVANADGTASGGFQAELESRGLLTSADHDAEADAIAAFLLGQNAPGGWKLPGVSNSAPVVVRRVPPFRANRLPEVAINDPHCAGRLFGELDAGSLPNSLEDFARDSNSADNILGSPSAHNEYQEAVLVGDDMGVLHAFQLNSGNELWGFLPNELLPALAAQAANGAASMGQPADIEDHIYGVSATLNHGFAFDAAGSRWVHLGVFGFGIGGQEFYALDLSHMSPESPDGPFEILWTTEDAALKGSYDNLLGQTWARPALTYYVPGDALTSTPEARLVLGSGYQASASPQPSEGRTLVLADGVTGALLDTAELPALTQPVFEASFGALVDPAVGSHCLSRYWAEAQETYIADPAGRLFRWDLGAVGNTFPHDADSVEVWGGNAQPVMRFPACEGVGTDCTVADGNRGDVFVFAPAVSASNRIDDFTAVANGTVNDEQDQFLVALISGTAADETIDGRNPANAFHSSLYLLVDDHRAGDKHLGFTIPAGAPKSIASDSVAGATFTADPAYLRLALSDIVRTRVVVPYEGASPITETRAFSKLARPIRAPRIYVTGVADSTSGAAVVVEDLEVYNITYTVYEPGSGECNEAFYDAANNTWHFDQGSTYEITFRLVANSASGFNFTAGASPPGVDFGGGFTPALTLASVSQLTTEGCTGGACGMVAGGGSAVPCDNNSAAPPAGVTGFAVPTSTAQIAGFTPVE